MKKIILTLSAAALMLGMASCGKKAENVVLHNQTDTLSWAMGISLGETVKSGFYQFDEEMVMRAFQSVINNEKQPLDAKSYKEACDYIAHLASIASHQQAKEQAAQAKATDAELFAQLKQSHPDLKVTESGICYEVLREGKGPKAQMGLRIKFDYKGAYLNDGAIIDQTYGRRDPIVHVVSPSMFPGLREGLQLMNAGSKYRFYFTSEQAAGAIGVEPNRAVVYEVELHEIYKD